MKNLPQYFVLKRLCKIVCQSLGSPLYDWQMLKHGFMDGITALGSRRATSAPIGGLV